VKCDPWGIREGLATFGGVRGVRKDLKFRREDGEDQKLLNLI
jgi:hypothetical protein